MKDNSLRVFTHEGKEYIRGFDYMRLKNVNMGVDSQFGYYELTDELKAIIKENNLNVLYQELDRSELFSIRSEYYDELGDTLIRIKRADLNDLYSWKKSMDEIRGEELFNEQTYNLVLEEIKKRESEENVKREVLSQMVGYLRSLYGKYGKDVVLDCIKKLPDAFRQDNIRKK